MREIVYYIDELREYYESHELFVQLLTDESLPGERRLAWAPSVVPFVMGYSDLNKYVLRKGEGDADLDPLQAMLNARTYEADFPWQWMLNDLERLGADGVMPRSDAARVLWGTDFQHSRRLCLELAALASDAPAYAVFAMVQAIEAISIAIFERCQAITLHDGRECEFFGTKHYLAQASRSLKSPDLDAAALPILDEPRRERAKLMVDRVFVLFDEWSTALLRFANENEAPALDYARMVRQSKDLRPADGASL